MLWAIIWDIIGWYYEWASKRDKSSFELFKPLCAISDDTVLTIAVMDTLLWNWDYTSNYKYYYSLYQNAGFGTNFALWAEWKTNNNDSYWNWAAMRVSPISYVFDTIEEVQEEAKNSAIPSHSHPEWIRWAQTIASAVFLARKWKSKLEIKEYLENTFWYNLSLSLEEIRNEMRIFDASCQKTVFRSIMFFIHGEDYEDTIRIAVSMWGDTDTNARMAWWIAEAFYGWIPDEIKEKRMTYMDERIMNVYNNFISKFK